MLFFTHQVARCSTLTSESLHEFGACKVGLRIQARIKFRCSIRNKGEGDNGIIRMKTGDGSYVEHS